jgi:tetratricopeptide (TPR) repeat protein
MGLTYSAQGDFENAQSRFRKAIDIDADAWESLLNLAEIHQIKGDSDTTLQLFERAYSAMENKYQEQPQKIEPWQAELGVYIAEAYKKRGVLKMRSYGIDKCST